MLSHCLSRLDVVLQIVVRDGRCPGNQGKVRENEKGLKCPGKSQGIQERKGKSRKVREF